MAKQTIWDRQLTLAARALSKADADPDIQIRWMRLSALIGPRFGWALEYADAKTEAEVSALAGEGDDPIACLEDLEALVRERVPSLAWLYGPYLQQFLVFWIVVAGSSGDAPDWLIPRRIHRLLPDNPIWIDGEQRLHDWQTATPKHFAEVIEAAGVQRATSGCGHRPMTPNVPAEVYKRLVARMRKHVDRGCSFRTTDQLVGVKRGTTERWLSWEAEKKGTSLD